MIRRASLPPAVLLAALVGACGPSDEAREAAAVLHAVDVVRDAPAEPLDARKALLKDLERVPAQRELPRNAKEACVAAYRPLLEGSALEARVRKSLAGPGGANALGDLADLATAEKLIEQSKAAMPRCEAALAELRRADRAR